MKINYLNQPEGYLVQSSNRIAVTVMRKLWACDFSVCVELKHVLDMIQLESVELERVKVQHSQKLDQLEKSQETLLQVRPSSKAPVVLLGHGKQIILASYTVWQKLIHTNMYLICFVFFYCNWYVVPFRCVWSYRRWRRSCRSNKLSRRGAGSCRSRRYSRWKNRRMPQLSRGAACWKSAPAWRLAACMLRGSSFIWLTSSSYPAAFRLASL